MFALGCIQAQRCNTNECPTGVATQDPGLVEGLVVADKGLRVRNFQLKRRRGAIALQRRTSRQAEFPNCDAEGCDGP
jgi:glutamate synthase domain-containing protein 2